MRRIALLFVLVIGLAAASAARSQQPITGPQLKPATPAKDSVIFKPSPELQRSLDDLANALQSLAERIKSDPQIRTAAMNVASGFVTTAQQVIAEQSGAIEEALKTAAERIDAAQKNQKTPARK
jgi:gas vesicle protein